MSWNPEQDRRLDAFLEANDPLVPQAPLGERERIRRRLERPSIWSLQWSAFGSAAAGMAAALLLWVALPANQSRVAEEDWWETPEAEFLLEEEPATEWAALIQSVD